MHNREIKIKRNIIEKFLMKVKDFISKNKKVVLYLLISIVLLATVILAGVVYYQYKEQKELSELENILDNYYSAEKEQEKNFDKVIDDLNKLVDSSGWGYVNDNGYYIIAGLYLSLKKYKEGKEYLLKFVDESPSSYFAPLALHRAGIAYEELNDIDGAFQIYTRLGNEYQDSIVIDENYYNLGRMFQKKGDLFKAKEYYNKVISKYPMSIFVAKAKKRLLLLGYQK